MIGERLGKMLSESLGGRLCQRFDERLGMMIDDGLGERMGERLSEMIGGRSCRR